MDSQLVDPYELQLRKALDKVLPDAYESLKTLDQMPIEIGMKVLGVLVNYACESQNITVITLARDAIKKIPLKWLTQYYPEVVNRSIDWADEWQYIRLLEVTREVAPELLKVFIDRGLFSENDEIHETAEYFRSKQS
ncbi:hypothetical protein C173_05351 [Paenibacillus sp. FSL R7-277]|uniref:hypothetical protein n=1 Tax=unclassified Paenibacillus TaxID=185978 RepID=UPI0003E21518|nr:hypothetical protein [Paenibacillus sp. FSL R7-277]ETT77240.1 hypothetical protein C173_05351 [Paenibacillus sp. FSL R7-277]